MHSYSATPAVQRRLEQLLLRRAALNRVIGSLEEYDLFLRHRPRKPAARSIQSCRSNESVLACAVRAWQISKAARRRRTA
jgi:hypothetical protein